MIGCAGRNVQKFPVSDWPLTISDWHTHLMTIGASWLG